MPVFTIGFEDTLHVTVQSTDYADAGVHQEPIVFGGHHERLDCGLPFLELLFGLRQVGDVIGRLSKR